MACPLVVLAADANAEVSDKIPYIAEYPLWALGLCLLIFAISRLRWWAGFFVVPITLVLAGVALDVVLDPHAGPAAIHEQGALYPVAAYSSIAASAVAQVAGPLLAKRRQATRPAA